MLTSYTAAPDIEVLTSNFPIPGYGFVPINAFVIKGSEPILVETGAAIESADFMQALRSVIDPADLDGSGSATRTSTTSAACISCSRRTPACG